MLSLIKNPLFFIATGAGLLLFVFISPVLYGLDPCTDGICLTHPEAKRPTPPKVQRVTQKYGPYTVPGMNKDGGMIEFEDRFPLPCSDCFIAYMHAGLEYPDGSYANADTGMWLHHLVAFNLNRTDTTCPEMEERIFASGNERTPIDLTKGGTINVGYYVGTEDTFGSLIELMNEVPETRDAVVTVEFEYLPAQSHEFRPVKTVWLDIDGVCDENRAEVPPPADLTTFSLGMEDHWRMDLSGEVVSFMNHLHDGGLNLQVIRNGKTACDSAARYGESTGFVDAKMTHISSMSECPDLTVQRGEKWWVKANYDFVKHSPMMEGSTPAPVMGIALLYIVE